MKLTIISILLLLTQVTFAQNGAQIIRDENGKVISINSNASEQGSAKSSENSQSTSSVSGQLSNDPIEVEIAAQVNCFDFESGEIVLAKIQGGYHVCQAPSDLVFHNRNNKPSFGIIRDIAKDGTVVNGAITYFSGTFEELVDPGQTDIATTTRNAIPMLGLAQIYAIKTAQGNYYKMMVTIGPHTCNTGQCITIKYNKI